VPCGIHACQGGRSATCPCERLGQVGGAGQKKVWGLGWQKAAWARPKSATHDIKRDAILDIAAQCFAQRSYPAASMNEIATACGTSKARLYHYYESKEAILFDLLDRHTQRLLAVIAQTEATAQRKDLNERATLHELVRAFLQEYETSATRHAALLNDTQFLSDAVDPAEPGTGVSPRELILNRQRDIVAAMTRFMKRAYPERLTPTNQTALTMMLLGMINWTFTWLRPGGPISYAAFADEVISMLEKGLG
jgi:AcrR family transcriptional regulator